MSPLIKIHLPWTIVCCDGKMGERDPAREQNDSIGRLGVSSSAGVESPQHLLDLGVLLANSNQRILNLLQALVLVRLVGGARLVLHLAVVLNLLAGVLNLCETESGRRALEEVAEGR